MDEILGILEKDARISPEEIAELTKEKVGVIKKAISRYGGSFAK